MTTKEKKKRKYKPLTPEQRSIKHHRQRMKGRAAILSICPLGTGSYQVWGGTRPHIVQVLVGGEILCDCEGWKKARDHECSHVMKYKIVYGGLKK